jgi:chromosomal replication initiation ATPase DnaA
LLHFFNAVKEAKTGYLLMTANDNPANIGIRLADLRSRLVAVYSIRINDADDEMMRQMLVKKFAERQLKVEMEVINYIVSRAERSFVALDKIVEKLDTEALKSKKNITIPFVKMVFETV